MTRPAYGFGLATYDAEGVALDTWYPSPSLGEAPAGQQIPDALVDAERADALRAVTVRAVRTVIDLDAAPASVEDAYLVPIRRHVPNAPAIERVERFAFYERARRAFAVVMTGETAKYGNILLVKGVTPC